MRNTSSNLTLRYPNGTTNSVRLRSKPLNQGADGVIYAVPGGKLALKLYHEPSKDPERPQKIRQMLLAPPDDEGMVHFAWPIAKVEDNKGEFAGYAMPLLPLSEYANLDLLLTRKGRDLGKLPQSREFRIRAAGNLARRVAQLHDQGHFIIDLKPANMLVNRRTADIVVVDCDGFAIQGQDSFIPGHQYTTGYIAPEAWQQHAKPETLGEPQDLFALAVIIFQLLNEGLHPYQGVPRGKQAIPTDTQSRIGSDLFAYDTPTNPQIKPSPWSLHNDFPAPLASAFRKAFRSNVQRPTAKDWVSILDKAVSSLKLCASNPDHGFWGGSCVGCQQALVKVNVKRPSPRKPPLPTRRRPPQHPPRVTQPAARAPQPTTTRSGSSPFAQIMSIGFFVLLMVGYFAHLHNEKKIRAEWREEIEAREQARQEAKHEQEELEALRIRNAWREIGNMATAITVHSNFHELPVPINAFSRPASQPPEGPPPIVPHYSVGTFDSYRQLPIIGYSPVNVAWDYHRGKLASIITLDALANDYSEGDQRYAIGANHRVDEWLVHPDSLALYTRKCGFQMNCYNLARTDLNGEERLFKVRDTHVSDGTGHRQTIPPWHFAITASDERAIIADSHRLRIYATAEPDKPIAERAYPDDLQDMHASDLAITPDGQTIFVALSRYRNYGMNYAASVLEYTFTNDQLMLATRFDEIWPNDGSTPAPSVVVSNDGRTLVTGSYRDLEDDSTRYKAMGRTVTAKVAKAGIQIWQRNPETLEWSATGQYTLPRHDLLKTPDNPAAFGYSFNNVLPTSHRFNLDLQLSPDGTTLMSGIELEHTFQYSTIARAWVLDLSTPQPTVSYRLQKTVERRMANMNVDRINPFVRLSNNANEAVLGWAIFGKDALDRNPPGLELSLTAFRLGK
ncbi:protein kinase domain-containing protein [Marinobacter alkaliphilus]|uniref:Protein kinase domain-containing protein n=1 Tax=Marinobacter alkaliphilus TaxID=254719 RepID=A0ABZ3DZG4_9GAMM